MNGRDLSSDSLLGVAEVVAGGDGLGYDSREFVAHSYYDDKSDITTDEKHSANPITNSTMPPTLTANVMISMGPAATSRTVLQRRGGSCRFGSRLV